MALGNVGVSMRVLHDILTREREARGRGGTVRRPFEPRRRPAGDRLTTWDVCHEIVRPLTAKRRVSLYAAIKAGLTDSTSGAAFGHEDTGSTKVYTVHAWEYAFEDVVLALESSVAPGSRVWIDLAMINYWARDSPVKFLNTDLEFVLVRCTRVIVLAWPALEPRLARRSWCLLELALAKYLKKEVSVAMPPAELEAFTSAFREDAVGLYEALSDFSWSLSHVSVPSIKAKMEVYVTRQLDLPLTALRQYPTSLMESWLIKYGSDQLEAHPGDTTYRAQLGLLLKRRGKVDQAAALFREALRRNYAEKFGVAAPIARAVLSDGVLSSAAECLSTVSDGALMLSVGNSYAVILMNDGKLGEAEQLLRRVIRAREHELGMTHAATLVSMNNLGIVLTRQKRYGEAETLIQRVIDARESARGPDHPETLVSLSSMANLLQSKGEHSSAEEIYERVLKTSERTLGEDHADTLLAMNNLAALLHVRGAYDEAEALLRRAVAGRERTKGLSHPKTLVSMFNLGQLLRSKRDWAGAEKLFRSVVDVSYRELGPTHPNTLAAEEALEAMTSKLKKSGAYPASDAGSMTSVATRRHVPMKYTDLSADF